MKFKAIVRIILILFLMFTLSIGINRCQGFEEWVPYVPYSRIVNLCLSPDMLPSFVDVIITFPDAGYMISDWGTVVKVGYEIWVDSEIWDWTGPAALVVTTCKHTYDLDSLKEGNYTFTFKAWGFNVKSISFKIAPSPPPPPPPAVSATVDIDPNTLYLGSEGEWITCYIELPEGYSINDIDVSSLKLSNTISVDLNAPTWIGDYDGDNVPDLMVKFNRAELTSLIYHVLGITYGNVTLTITGQLFDGTLFEGYDTIRVLLGGDIDSDEYVGPVDLSIFAAAYGKHSEDILYNSYADLDHDKYISPTDLNIFAANYGKTIP